MAGYSRQSSSGIVDGGVISAEDLNSEFNQLATAFANGGHSHSGSAAEGPQITNTGLASGAVIEAKILDGAVTTNKVNDLAITAAKLAANAVTTAKILDDAVDNTKLKETDAYVVAGLTVTAASIVMEGATPDDYETTITVTDPTADRTVTIQDATHTLVGRDTTDTLTNKTLTTPVIAEIDSLSSGSITLDSEVDIILDADGGDITLKDAGTTFANLNNNSGELIIQSGSTPTTAVTFTGANVALAGTLGVASTATFESAATFEAAGIFDVSVTSPIVDSDAYHETYAVLTGTTPAANLTVASTFRIVLSGDTTFTFSNPVTSGTSQGFTVITQADSGGSGHAVTWPSSVKWAGGVAPTATSTANAVDIFAFFTHDGGTTYYGFVAGQGMS